MPNQRQNLTDLDLARASMEAAAPVLVDPPESAIDWHASPPLLRDNSGLSRMTMRHLGGFARCKLDAAEE